jgi:N-acetylneuraminate lyase
MNRQFYGAWPALLTPSTPGGGVGVTALREVTAYLLDRGVDGLYLCGSTGEGVHLTESERRLVTETVVDVVAGRVPVIVHVGAVGTREAVALAQHAEGVGAAGVASILPPFRRDIAEVYLHYATIAAAVPEMPFLPYLFGGEVEAPSLMQTLRDGIPSLAGAKYTGSNMYELQGILDLQGDWSIFSGMDEQCIFAAMTGAPGNIGTTLNFMPGVYKAMRARYAAGDGPGAVDLQLRANRVTRVLHTFGVFGALFEIMRMLGFECGEPRLPRSPLPPERRLAFHAALEQTDFAKFAAM